MTASHGPISEPKHNARNNNAYSLISTLYM